MRLLVTGGSGLVGWKILQYFHRTSNTVEYTYYSTDALTSDPRSYRLDIRDGEKTDRIISESDPDVVVHSAAMAEADACERNSQSATEINVEGTKNVVSACESQDAVIAFISSNMVFDGKEDVYYEDSERNSLTKYGETKIRGEDIVRESPVDSLVVRIDQPYCWPMAWQTETFVSWVYERLQRGEPFPVFTDWVNTPVFADDMTDALLTLVEQGATGTYHVVGSESVSRYDWARRIAEKLGFDPALIREGHSTNADLPATRPNALLSNRRIRDECDVSFRSIDESLEILDDRRTRDSFSDGAYTQYDSSRFASGPD